MKSKKEDTRPITYKQIKYLKRLMRNSEERIRGEDMGESNSLKAKIEEVGVDNLTLEVANGYIATFVAFDKLYQDQYEIEAMEIDNSSKVIDLFSYKNS